MNSNELTALLARADSLLERVSVSGEGVFALAEARRTLKKAYDAAQAETSVDHEYNVNRKDDPT